MNPIILLYTSCFCLFLGAFSLYLYSAYLKMIIFWRGNILFEKR